MDSNCHRAVHAGFRPCLRLALGLACVAACTHTGFAPRQFAPMLGVHAALQRTPTSGVAELQRSDRQER